MNYLCCNGSSLKGETDSEQNFNRIVKVKKINSLVSINSGLDKANPFGRKQSAYDSNWDCTCSGTKNNDGLDGGSLKNSNAFPITTQIKHVSTIRPDESMRSISFWSPDKVKKYLKEYLLNEE